MSAAVGSRSGIRRCRITTAPTSQVSRVRRPVAPGKCQRPPPRDQDQCVELQTASFLVSSASAVVVMKPTKPARSVSLKCQINFVESRTSNYPKVYAFISGRRRSVGTQRCKYNVEKFLSTLYYIYSCRMYNIVIIYNNKYYNYTINYYNDKYYSYSHNKIIAPINMVQSATL